MPRKAPLVATPSSKSFVSQHLAKADKVRVSKPIVEKKFSTPDKVSVVKPRPAGNDLGTGYSRK